ncbi:hypothetical protein PpBr36_07812 [Pyricularia pennisetigena]|uniref:hypothetical protein n=1 Tax=Pyricularia pennisetigena TaxID=1578925 RepID=UPI00114DE17F|nr:hypothetical protein PpBr36_07812 [Pyricularia pennisetigena]TLS25451.1 hypothetical protein PpBr36_07812 [Pyricularia pennisetigena]
MQLSSIIAASFLAQSILASPMPSGNQDAPRTAAGNRAAADLDDPDKIPFHNQWELCMELCRTNYRGFPWKKEKHCEKKCSDLKGK